MTARWAALSPQALSLSAGVLRSDFRPYIPPCLRRGRPLVGFAQATERFGPMQSPDRLSPDPRFARGLTHQDRPVSPGEAVS